MSVRPGYLGGTLPERFWAKVDKNGEGGCWLWTGARCKRLGYGSIRGHRAGNKMVHRIAYELCVGPIPEGLDIDHLCRVRHCVNPAHLEAVTHRENILRSPDAPMAVQARQTHCKRGHPFDAENTYIRPSDGGRQCKACTAMHAAALKVRRGESLTLRMQAAFAEWEAPGLEGGQ